MNQDKLLIEVLKSELKKQGVAYKDIAAHLSLSEGSIKRLFSTYDFSLSRLQNICSLINLDFSDLVEIMQATQLSTDKLSIEHEEKLVADIPLLLTAHLLINKWSVNQILSHYQIDSVKMTQLLAQLDRMNVIEYLPGERVRLKISRNFTWLPNGPIQQFFEKHIEHAFFNCHFTSPGEIKLFNSGMLTKQSNDEMQRQIKKLGCFFDDLHQSDSKEDLTHKFGTSLMIAMRPWDIKLFNELRKAGTEKIFK
ncbi:helix-turn-helix domain-containing protein [Algibacillus agarilyticus]|uniref:helix-turn-helix domain-containing protein n=1 Tax=Algibacillus agarilyticus TaxID=2234133 RepID=UPI000DD00428|nr:helix-turn-helix domain-containing protein [Algibacillus agarilyticus]